MTRDEEKTMERQTNEAEPADRPLLSSEACVMISPPPLRRLGRSKRAP